MRNRKNKGFTLLELLVVVAIIGILSAILLVTFSGPREKSRDAKRVSDIKQMKNALELYFADYGEYPISIADLVSEYLPDTPKDPYGDDYLYYPYISSTPSLLGKCVILSQVCIYYQLGTNLETKNHGSLKADSDIGLGHMSGDDLDGCSGETDRYCYDITP